MADPRYPHLKYLGYRQIFPSRPLREYVQCYWVIERHHSLDVLHEEFLHPGGGMGIVFNLGDELRLNGIAIPYRYFLDGYNTVTTRLGLQGHVKALGVRFHPAGAYPFLAIPPEDVIQNLISLADSEFRSIHHVNEQIMNTASVTKQIAIIENWLLRCLSPRLEIPDLIRATLHTIRDDKGVSSMKTIADDLFVSQRQLERIFKHRVGISPKHFARLIRVEQARDTLKQVENLSLGELSQQLGFYDQSHFIREFRSIVGMTPHAYALRHAHRLGNE